MFWLQFSHMDYTVYTWHQEGIMTRWQRVWVCKTILFRITVYHHNLLLKRKQRITIISTGLHICIIYIHLCSLWMHITVLYSRITNTLLMSNIYIYFTFWHSCEWYMSYYYTSLGKKSFKIGAKCMTIVIEDGDCFLHCD